MHNDVTPKMAYPPCHTSSLGWFISNGEKKFLTVAVAHSVPNNYKKLQPSFNCLWICLVLYMYWRWVPHR